MRIVLTVLALAVALDARADTVVFEGVRLIDVATATVSEPTRVGIRDGFIVDASAIDRPDRTVTTEGYLIPGLAEMHAHVPSGRVGDQAVRDTLGLWLAHGITTIRGMLGEPGHLRLRQQLADGELTGPRLITSGPSFNGNSVASPAQARRQVLAQQEAGYDFLKLHPGLSVEDFDALSRAADALGIDYSGHVSVAVGLDRVLASRQGTIDHLDGYTRLMVPEDNALHGTDPGLFGVNLVKGMDPDLIPELARRTAEAGIANVPTQSLIENWRTGDLEALMQRDAMRWIAPETAARWRQQAIQLRGELADEDAARYVTLRRQLIRALHEAGAMILAGADSPQILSIPGDAIHHELLTYVESGLTPAEALATATINVAAYLGETHRSCLQPGCVADLVLLTANPLQDIGNTRSIAGVMRAGEWFDRQHLDDILAAIAKR
ncbi:amidohydrolase family protein [Chromatocurvus halotolerans]|uniref:Amidohydrolase family protein n=1 Tax=Chromatocurvus halotolerans TaxID=1132028 RepID=A0A4R2L005_9GAMM|nr:amidohydrolase family protein [Chromatocurvus halotolerans]TCO78517.1 amidohydrolase family protein [Chromatocurvus halotolerans]